MLYETYWVWVGAASGAVIALFAAEPLLPSILGGAFAGAIVNVLCWGMDLLGL